jgi:hypothetical protein
MVIGNRSYIEMEDSINIINSNVISAIKNIETAIMPIALFLEIMMN